MAFGVSFFFFFGAASVFSFFEDDGPAVGVEAASILRFFLELASSLFLGLPLVVATLDVVTATDGAAGRPTGLGWRTYSALGRKFRLQDTYRAFEERVKLIINLNVGLREQKR